MKKVGSPKLERAPGGSDHEQLKRAIEEFAKDIPKIRKHVKESGNALNENLSRRLVPQRAGVRRDRRRSTPKI